MEKIYGKPYSNELLKIKSSFYNENDVLLKERVRANAIYNQQPIRKNCKMCGKPLDGMNHFKSHEVLYYFCDNCHHLNGGHEETADFCEHIYVEEDYGKEYVPIGIDLSGTILTGAGEAYVEGAVLGINALAPHPEQAEIFLSYLFESAER